jgi:hypothetical protein
MTPPGFRVTQTLDQRPAQNVPRAPVTRLEDRATATAATHEIRVTRVTHDRLARIAKGQRDRRDVTAREADQIDRRALAIAHPRR